VDSDLLQPRSAGTAGCWNCAGGSTAIRCGSLTAGQQDAAAADRWGQRDAVDFVFVLIFQSAIVGVRAGIVQHTLTT
jgi:hypothetical protein